MSLKWKIASNFIPSEPKQKRKTERQKKMRMKMKFDDGDFFHARYNKLLSPVHIKFFFFRMSLCIGSDRTTYTHTLTQLMWQIDFCTSPTKPCFLISFIASKEVAAS